MLKLNSLIKISCYFILYFATIPLVYSQDLYLIFDNFNQHVAPKHYRTGIYLSPNKLNISGSSQPNLKNLKYIIKKAKQIVPDNHKIFIIDLRQEPHVLLNKYAISWFGFRNQASNTLEEQLIEYLKITKKIKIYLSVQKLKDGNFKPKNPTNITIKTILTEQQAIEKLGVQYKRFLVTDHYAPTDNQIDLFIQFIKTIPTDHWLHFHCRGGRGRTTTFMALYDIIKNAESLSLDQILERQHQLGGIKLSKIKFKLLRKQWKEPAAKERYELITSFYKYRLDPEGFNKKSWQEWRRATNL